MRIVHALLGLVLLLNLARAQDGLDLENLVWQANLTDVAPFALQFVQSYDHETALVRGFDRPVRLFFAGAKLEETAPSLLDIALQDAPWSEEVDGRARNVVILLSTVAKSSPSQVVMSFADFEGGSGVDTNPQSITRELEIGLIRALDERFPRVRP